MAQLSFKRRAKVAVKRAGGADAIRENGVPRLTPTRDFRSCCAAVFPWSVPTPPPFCWRRRGSKGPAIVPSSLAIVPLEPAVSWLHRAFLQVLKLGCHGSIRFQKLQQLEIRPFQAIFLG